MLFRSGRRAASWLCGGALRAVLFVGLVAAASACSDEAKPDEPSNKTPEPTCEGRGEPIVLGMSKLSEDGLLSVSLTAASPLPPVQGVNSWTLDVTNEAGPVTD